MISAKYDRIVNIKDNQEYAAKIPAVFAHIELEADHLSFLTGKNMSYMQSVLTMLEEVNPGKVQYHDIDESEVVEITQKLGYWGKSQF